MTTPKNGRIWYTAAVFAYLYAGNVVRAPYYDSKNPVLSFFFTSLAVLFLSFGIARYFACHTAVSSRYGARLFAGVAAVLSCVYCGSLIEKYSASLAGFSPEYGTLFAILGVAAVIIWTCVYGASHGRVCVIGFAMLTFWLFAVWTAASFFAFFSTSPVLPLESPFGAGRVVDIPSILGEMAYVLLDMVFLAVVLSDNETDKVKSTVPRAFVCGSVLFVIVSGANLFKNLLLFGEELAVAAKSPDLAAFRLVPLFDLPEMSVVVDSFACVLKVGVALCAVFYLLKDAYGVYYKHRVSQVLVFCVTVLGFGGLVLLRRAGLFSEKVAFAVLGVLGIAAFLLFVLYSKRPEKEKIEYHDTLRPNF